MTTRNVKTMLLLRQIVLVAAGFLVLGFGGCSRQSEDGADQSDSASLRIVATTTQAGDIMRVLSDGLGHVDVAILMGAGVDPHLYQPSEADVRLMSNADLIVYSGLNLEGQFERVFRALRQRGTEIFSMGSVIEQEGFALTSGEDAYASDPHFWFDPRNWQLVATSLGEYLADIDAPHAAVYQERAQTYVAQLDALFSWAEEGLASVPEGQRHLVTSHDAFRYFGSAFGWSMRAIQGLSTEDTAGVGDIQETVDFVIQQSIPVLFVESSVPPDTIRAVQEAVRAQGADVDLAVREMYGDAMDDPGLFGGTYIGMLGTNVMTSLQSYQCAGVDAMVPPWPEELPDVPGTLTSPDCE